MSPDDNLPTGCVLIAGAILAGWFGFIIWMLYTVVTWLVTK